MAEDGVMPQACLVPRVERRAPPGMLRVLDHASTSHGGEHVGDFPSRLDVFKIIEGLSPDYRVFDSTGRDVTENPFASCRRHLGDL